jgi:hypothetical protein
MPWQPFTPESQPDLARDYWWFQSGDVTLIHREIEAKYRALYGLRTTGQWSYTRPSVYQNWCMSCCGTHQAMMLTGYCLAQRFDGCVWYCDRCGHNAELAMVKLDSPAFPCEVRS